ncbi:MAG: hypothetical protein GDA53_07640 [Rhodobacteraceae bacterium]|nr:hypothetical protein [Paracoccaceae bacterium]
MTGRMGLAGMIPFYGKDGNDTLDGGAGADTPEGGDDSDWASYAGSAAAVQVNLGGGVMAG